MFFIVIAVIFCYYRFFISKTIINYVNNEINSLVTKCVNKTVLETLSDGVRYEELVYVEKDNNGNVTLLATDAYKTNYINREVAVLTQDFLKVECDKGVDVPFGAFTGVALISGIGESVNIKVINSQSVICDFVSTFEGKGINQTRHAIYIEVISIVKIVLPFIEKEVSVTTEVLVCDAIIVGKIPEVYLGGSLFN